MQLDSTGYSEHYEVTAEDKTGRIFLVIPKDDCLEAMYQARDLHRNGVELAGVRKVCRWYNARGEVFQTTRHSEKSDALAEAACCYRGGNRATIQRAVMDGPDYPHVGPEEDAP